MPDNTQDLEFGRTERGNGRLVSERGEFAVGSFLLTKPKYAYASPWTLSGSLKQGTDRGLSKVFHLHRSLELDGRTTNGLTVRARLLHFSSFEAEHFTATAEEVQIGPEKLPSIPSDQSVAVFLTPTELAPRQVPLFTQYWTGEVKGTGEKAIVQKWRSKLGTFDLFTRFAFEKTEVGGLRSTISVPRPALFLSLKDGSHTADISQLVLRLREELEPLMRLLTLLSRQNVDWCEIEIWSRYDAEAGSETTIFSKRSSPTSRPDGMDPLVDTRFLPELGIDSMLRALLSLPYHKAILSSIGFLVGGQEGYLENQVISSFTALETIVSAISEHQDKAYILDQEAFRKLCRSIRTAIKTHGNENSINTSQRAALYAKLPELRRAPIIEQIVRALDENPVNWGDLWPSGSNLTHELREAYERRSILIHSGMIADYQKALEDSIRMHVIAERLLYNMLGGQPTWLSPWAYGHAYGLQGT